MKLRVYYEDTDCGGVVYHSNYLNFCERARSNLFFEKGLSPHISNTEFFVVKSLEANFIQSAKFGDDLVVLTNLVEKKAASLTLKQKVLREKDGQTLFEMSVKLVFLNSGKPSKIPVELFEVFND